MDFATLVGIVSGFAIVVLAIFLGGDFGTFVNIPSFLIVIGGAMSATVIRFTFADVFVALKTGAAAAFKQDRTSPQMLIEQLCDLAGTARKEGPLGLEQVDIEHPFLNKGIQFLIDGLDPEVLRAALDRDREMTLERLTMGEKIFRAIAEAAPAFGMIGTLVGLVQMLSTMDDPAKIGPAMAVALLTTLYGSLIASIIAIPIADKLSTKIGAADINLTLMSEGIGHIQNKVHPDLIVEFLNSYLPAHQRIQPAEAAA